MRFNEWLRSIAEAGRELWQRGRGNGRGSAAHIDELCAELCSIKGEALGTAIAQAVVAAYSGLGDAQRLAFFQRLAQHYGPDREAILAQAECYREQDSIQSLNRLEELIEGQRRNLFQRINMAPGATPVLVGMRKVLLELLPAHPQLRVVENDLLHVLRPWFNRGFLRLQAISWETPAHILEKLIAYEAVHEMQGWEDLRRRLAADRRCFAFFHPALPGEPLIFVQIALVQGMASSVQALLSDAELTEPQFDTAIFYSISNCQEGLRGISFGNFLIKQVVLELQHEFRQLRDFATLSPIPGFRRWLESELETPAQLHFDTAQRELLDIDHRDDPRARELLLSLCAIYLVHAKRGSEPLDPVERFHLGNGARIERLNWMGDRSDSGMAQSFGLQVNYGYHLRHVESNHERFVNEHHVVMSGGIRKLVVAGEHLLARADTASARR